MIKAAIAEEHGAAALLFVLRDLRPCDVLDAAECLVNVLSCIFIEHIAIAELEQGQPRK